MRKSLFYVIINLRARETVIGAKSQETKASLQWEKTGRKHRKAMGSTGGTAKSGHLVWRNSAGRKLEGVLDLFCSVPKCQVSFPGEALE